MGRGGGSGWGDQGGCDRRIEVFVKIQKKKMGGGVSGESFRVDVNKELKFLGKWGWVGGSFRVDVNKELKFLGKFTKIKFGVGGWGQGGCERRIEVFGKIRGSGWWGGGQGGCERRIEVFVKITKKNWGGGGLGVGLVGGQGGCELEVFVKIVFWGGRGEGSGWGGGSG